MGRSADPKLTRVAASTVPAMSVRRRPSLRVGIPATAAAYASVPLTELEDTPTLRRRWPRRLLVVLGGAALVLAAYIAWVSASVAGFESHVYVPRPPTPAQAVLTYAASPTAFAQAAQASPTPDSFSDLPKGRINLLLLGTDKRDNDPDHYARTDTIILVNIDTEAHKVRVLPVPRDLEVEIPGYGVNKINAAYLFGEYYKEPGGGQALMARTISQLFDVPVDYYAAVNFDGFRKLIDTVGGVDIDVPYEMDDYHYPTDDEGDPFGETHVHFSAGQQHMDGKTALRYARTRHADNDFMRSKRQLQVVLAARRSALSLNLIPTLPSLLDQLGGMLQTDIPFSQQLSLARLGYGLKSSDILTSTIGSDLITPATLKDGSEALRLNWKAARPMLADFFGTSVVEAATSAPSRDTVTPELGTHGTRKATATPHRTRTVTPLLRASPSSTPSPQRARLPGR